MLLTYDNDTDRFMESMCLQTSTVWRAMRDLLHSAIGCCLRTSDTNASAIVGRGNMHVLSFAHVESLLFSAADYDVHSQTLVANKQGVLGAPLRADRAGMRLLDVGAGTGSVTERLAPFFTDDGAIVTTETSVMNARLLRSRGYTCVLESLPTAEAVGQEPFDLVSCLNVLDRCDKPLSLLRTMAERLRAETGRMLVSIVLPYRPSVERGRRWESPTEYVAASRELVRAGLFERWLCWFVQTFFEPAGLEVLRISKVPYLSQGDLASPYYVLPNAVFVLRRAAM